MTQRLRFLVAALALVLSACATEAATVEQQLSAEPATTGGALTPARAARSTDPGSDPGSAPVDRTMPDLAVLSHDGSVVVVRDGEATPPTRGIIASDQTTLVETTVDGTTTAVAFVDLATGVESSRHELAGLLTPVATDMTGRVVALTAPAADGNVGTEIVVVDATTGEVFRHSYGSELLPEGFSNATMQGSSMPISMFVVEYLEPPNDDSTDDDTQSEAPRRYRVRVLDLTTAELMLPFNLRDKSQLVDEDMLGFSRTRVMSQRDGLLFTLYRGLEEDATQYAFVHTLGFVNGVWCLDLPAELWLERLPGAVALVDDERTLVVASANGYVTEFVVADILDPSREPLPARTEPAWSAAPNAGAPALASSGDTLLVGQGNSLRWLDVATLTTSHQLTIDMSIDAVALLDGGDALVAGTAGVTRITLDGVTAADVALPDGFGTPAAIVVLEAQ